MNAVLRTATTVSTTLTTKNNIAEMRLTLTLMEPHMEQLKTRFGSLQVQTQQAAETIRSQ